MNIIENKAISVWLSLLLTCTLATPLLGNKREADPVLLKVGIDSKNVYFALKNTSTFPVKIYNQWRQYDRGFVPNNVDIYLLDREGLQKLKGDVDGLWHFGAKKEEMIMKNVPSFELLSPGKEVRLQMPLSFITTKLRGSYLKESSGIKVTCRVYHSDEYFEKSVAAESKWLEMPVLSK